MSFQNYSILVINGTIIRALNQPTWDHHENQFSTYVRRNHKSTLRWARTNYTKQLILNINILLREFLSLSVASTMSIYKSKWKINIFPGNSIHHVQKHSLPSHIVNSVHIGSFHSIRKGFLIYYQSILSWWMATYLKSFVYHQIDLFFLAGNIRIISLSRSTLCFWRDSTIKIFWGLKKIHLFFYLSINLLYCILFGRFFHSLWIPYKNIFWLRKNVEIDDFSAQLFELNNIRKIIFIAEYHTLWIP